MQQRGTPDRRPPRMALLLVIVFLVAPFVELAVIISVADSIGVFRPG